MPIVKSIKRRNGIAGQTQFTAVVQYPDESPMTIAFVGYPDPTTTGPVVTISPSGHQMFVTDPSRFGPFGEQWVRRFFADHD